MLDHTHNAAQKSWIGSANGHADFPLQNLPFGVFSTDDRDRRGGVAIGDMILDLQQACSSGLFAGDAFAGAAAASKTALNEFFALGSGARVALRSRLFDLLSDDADLRERTAECLVPASTAQMHLPAQVGDYTDFYVGIHHATNVGRQFRPDNPLLPNYKHVPIGYHGRSSSIVVSGTSVRRPRGQTKGADADAPTFGPSRRLDYELELGIWMGPGNLQGESIPVDRAAANIAGYCLLNDWSARDIQAWEYQPLGPFLSKNFASTISAWVVMPEALAPFRCAQPARPVGDPTPLPYLVSDEDQANGAFDLELDVFLVTDKMRKQGLPPHRLARSNTKYMYWTAGQLVTHHTCNGCNLRPGDLLGTGTISGPTSDSCGSILEITGGGKNPVQLPSGERRAFLEDGDEVILKVRGVKAGFASIGFGECRGLVLQQ